MYGNLIHPQVPQNKRARADQVPNNAGGFAFQIDKWQQLQRFILIGSADGSYYVSAPDLTKLNLDAVKACIAEDGLKVCELVRDLSQEGRAVKNDPAILVLATCLKYGDDRTKAKARAILPEVCRTGTHLEHFALYSDKLRGWGRALRSAIKGWYESQASRGVDSLAYQMVKYQSRDGWSHKDLIRLSHVGANPKQEAALAALYDWALHGIDLERQQITWYPNIVQAFEEAKSAAPGRIVELINSHGLSREMVPTDKLNDPQVATALALKSPPWAMLRNLGNWTKLGLLEPGPVRDKVLATFSDAEALRKARLHPITILIALKTYASGQGVRGSNAWTPVPQVIDALDKAFYLSFKAAEPTKQRIHVAVDVSGSMSAECQGTPGFQALEAGAAMALVTAAVEPNYSLVAFDTSVHEWSISPRSRLDDVMAQARRWNGGTDVAAPIMDLLQKRRSVDAFVIYTDSETWAGNIHPYQAIQEYRRTVNAQAKLIILAMAANHVTVADPTDALSLSVAGFDASIPDVIKTFLTEQPIAVK